MAKQLNDFKVGDKVRHISGTGPTMAVTGIIVADNNVHCEWFSENQDQFTYKRLPHALEHYKESPIYDDEYDV